MQVPVHFPFVGPDAKLKQYNMPFKYNIIEYRVSLCLIILDLVAFFIDSHWQLIPGFNSSHCKICLTKNVLHYGTLWLPLEDAPLHLMSY